ncbi:hypothetical protein EYF80_032222 [Liparis tanakae]|uniref:Uncharacterized protein n=1 Tax=Liparis tanakae TaxID=230148 RepID=A0A4Z2GVK0_9TELE|nr:hypothetical protein EYF80_032222 [Liparis tanakae]
MDVVHVQVASSYVTVHCHGSSTNLVVIGAFGVIDMEGSPGKLELLLDRCALLNLVLLGSTLLFLILSGLSNPLYLHTKYLQCQSRDTQLLVSRPPKRFCRCQPASSRALLFWSCFLSIHQCLPYCFPNVWSVLRPTPAHVVALQKSFAHRPSLLKILKDSHKHLIECICPGFPIGGAKCHCKQASFQASSLHQEVPTQPRNDISMCIMLGLTMTYFHRTGSNHWMRHASI